MTAPRVLANIEDLVPFLDDLDADTRQEWFGEFAYWIGAGSGVAVYRNVDIGDTELMHRQILSFGTQASSLVTASAPEVLPDGPTDIGWRYQLEAVLRRGAGPAASTTVYQDHGHWLAERRDAMHMPLWHRSFTDRDEALADTDDDIWAAVE